jgi:hypothetical protein
MARFNPKSVTNDELINELKKLANDLGRTPSQTDMKKSNYNLVAKVHLYRQRFGSIQEAQKLAGLDPNKSGSDMKYSDEELLGEIKRIYDVLSFTPSQTDIEKYGVIPIGAFKRRFGTYSCAVEKLGLTPNNPIIYSLDDIKNDILRISSLLGRPPTAREFGEHSETVSETTAMNKISGNNKWNDVIKICGLDPSFHRNITNQDLREEIVRLTNKLGYIPGYGDMSRMGKFCSETYASRFGTYLKALEFFGFDYEPQSQWSNCVFIKGKDGIFYRSKFESNIANILFYLKRNNKITSYSYEKLICDDRKWTCDFYVCADGKEWWIEADGMEHRRDVEYSEHNEKIKYYIDNDFNYHILAYKTSNIERDVLDILFNGKGSDINTIMKNYNLKKRVKKWSGPEIHEFVENNNIADKQYYFDTLIKWKKSELDRKYLCSINEDLRDEIVPDLFLFFRKYDFSKIEYSKESIKSDYQSIMGYNLQLDENNHISNNISAGLRLCKQFFPNMIKISTTREKSVIDVINDDESLFKIIRNRIGNTLLTGKEKRQTPYSISPSAIVRGAKSMGIAAMGSFFKPVVAKTIYSHWVKDGQVIYDYSAGFGGRLLGFHATGLKAKYIGTDTNTETYNGLCKMRDELGINADIYNVPSEDFIPEKIDFAFSSPPYFNHEIYCDEDTQSYNKYPKYEDWLEQYWGKTVQNIKCSLNEGGIFAINAGNFSNPKMEKIHDDLNNKIKSLGFTLVDTWHMHNTNSHFNKSAGKKLEPIHFYRLEE